MSERPVSIEVEGLSKGFDILTARTPLRDRIRGKSEPRSRRLEVLKDINFDVRQGEFFGIVGRNGSGKSTLLKVLASVYAPDTGRVRIAGRLAPFLELGVGFDQQQPARENVILNAVMMGLTPAEAERRCDEVIDFAGLRDFTDLQLKNYSSGMKVRLAFAALTQVDADVLLLDEVLAVGDAEFQERCELVFKRLKDEGRTIVLVTHSMSTVAARCDRAMLIHDGVIDSIGRSVEVANRYIEINMRSAAMAGANKADFALRLADVIANPPVRIVDSWIHGLDETSENAIPEREPIEIRLIAETLRPIDKPGFQFRIDDDKGMTLFGGGSAELELEGGAVPGDRLEIAITIENRLTAGTYVLGGGIVQQMPNGDTEPASAMTPIRFKVVGDEVPWVLSLEHEVSMKRAAEQGAQS